MTAPAIEPRTASVGRLGGTILREIGIEPVPDLALLAARIVPDRPSPFRGDLRAGLEMLLRATAVRDPRIATAAACRLVGVGPGSTPLGDDYLAASGLTVATLGARVELGPGERAELVRALYPRGLATVTTPSSAAMIAAALDGTIPEPVEGLFRLDADEGALATPIDELTRVGATSGRAWAAAIGATALLLSRSKAPRQRPGGDRG